jgi:hypothetical protein
VLPAIQFRIFLPSHLQPKHPKLKVTEVLPIVLYVHETLSPAIREEHRLMVFESRILRGTFYQSGRKWQEVGQNCITRSFILCTHHQILG